MTLREAIYQAAIAQMLEALGSQFSGDRAWDRVIPLAAGEVQASLIHSPNRERERLIAR